MGARGMLYSHSHRVSKYLEERRFAVRDKLPGAEHVQIRWLKIWLIPANEDLPDLGT